MDGSRSKGQYVPIPSPSFAGFWKQDLLLKSSFPNGDSLTDSSPGLDSSFLLAFPGFPSDIFEQELLLTVAGPLRLIPDSLLCFRICQKCEIVQKTTFTV